jgi:hypothetical protein
MLRDFGDRPDGFKEGVKTWYGPSLLLVCSFYVSSEHRRPHYTNYIDASGMFYGEHQPMYYNWTFAN